VAIVTRLQKQQRRQDRVSVFLDGEYAFSLALDLAIELHRGQELNEDEIERLRTRDEVRSALDRAMRFLAYRPRSAAEVSRYLREKEVSEAAQHSVLQRLRELELVDDVAFAQWWVENRLQHQPRGAIALRSELSARGVPSEVIEEAISDLDEEGVASGLAVRRAHRYEGLDRRTFDKRLGGYLRRRGFSYEAVRGALNDAWDRLQRDQIDTS
jgi:regulatory protein